MVVGGDICVSQQGLWWTNFVPVVDASSPIDKLYPETEYLNWLIFDLKSLIFDLFAEERPVVLRGARVALVATVHARRPAARRYQVRSL